jgi:hypothetical protein
MLSNTRPDGHDNDRVPWLILAGSRPGSSLQWSGYDPRQGVPDLGSIGVASRESVITIILLLSYYDCSNMVG